MLTLLIFRLVLLSSFIISAVALGDWKSAGKYYPTVLFIMVVNLTASFLTYHHVLWNFNPDALVKTHTVLEILNSYIALPCTVFVFLSKLPSNKFYQYAFIGLWVSIFGTIEFIDKIIGGITYQHSWSWQVSIMFNFAIFSILRIHYSKPVWAWIITFIVGFIILIVFNFSSAEMK
ncbi:hypothetical protein SRRS_50290 [Sporomusa rhizae]|uniref:CBO0543 family protein n=1 Tax=Sporomusa rhizae TaxID=357999 RepID=UPI00352B7496